LLEVEWLTPMNETVEIIVNPFSRGQLGRVAKKIVEKVKVEYPEGKLIVSETSQFGFISDIEPNRYNSRVVCFIGGDSTARLMAQTSLVYKKKNIDFTRIPIGLGNDFGKQFLKGLTKRNLRKLLPLYLHNIVTNKLKNVSLDTLVLNDSCIFLSTFALGMDASVACTYHRFRKSKVGKFCLLIPLMPELVYFFTALWFGLKRSLLDKCVLRIRNIEDGTMSNISLKDGPITIQVTNSRYYGGAQISQDCKPNDRLFEVTVIRNFGHLLALFLTRLLPSCSRLSKKFIEQYRTSEVQIDLPDAGLDFHIDGEAATDFMQPYKNIVIKIGPQFDMAVPSE